MPKAKPADAADEQLLEVDLVNASHSALILAQNAITLELWRRLMTQ